MKKSSDINSIEIELTKFISQFTKMNLGKGPKDTELKIMDNTLVFFVRGILSPMEHNILESQEGERIVLEARRLHVRKANEKRITGFEKIIGSKVIEHYESWDLGNDSAVGVYVFEDNINRN